MTFFLLLLSLSSLAAPRPAHCCSPGEEQGVSKVESSACQGSRHCPFLQPDPDHDNSYERVPISFPGDPENPLDREQQRPAHASFGCCAYVLGGSPNILTPGTTGTRNIPLAVPGFSSITRPGLDRPPRSLSS